MTVDMELRHVRMAQTEDHLMKKLDRIFHQAEESGRCLTSQELDDVKDVWEAMKQMHVVKSMEGK